MQMVCVSRAAACAFVLQGMGVGLGLGRGGVVRASSSSSSLPAAKPIISAQEALSLWQADRGAIKFVDGSWHLDKTRSPHNEFVAEHLPGAVRFDVDKIADTSLDLPHMLPSTSAFGHAVSELGLDNHHYICVYTMPNCFSAARVWWTFRTMGHTQVSVLNGGINAWKAAGGPVESGEVAPKSTRPSPGLVHQTGNTWLLTKRGFQAQLQPELVNSWQQMLDITTTGKVGDILDARSEARFKALAPEPRPGLAGGHMPKAVNVPFNVLLEDGDFTKFKSVEEMRAEFEKRGVDLSDNRTVATTCGSGVTASVLSLAMHVCGKPLTRSPVYDGSWSEWGALKNVPIEK